MKLLKILPVLALLVFSSVDVNAAWLRNIFITDATTGKTAQVETNGGLAVNIQDQHSEIVDLYFHTHISGTYGINTNTTIDTYTIIIDSTVLPVVGNLICLKESGRYMQAAIISFTGANPYTLTLDSPLEYAFTTGGIVSLTEHDAAIDGSGTPVAYHITPPAGVEWDVVRVMFYIEDSTAMDDGLFGGAAALTNGIVLRLKDGIYHNIFNAKTNGEFAQRAYDRSYISKPPAGTGHSMVVRRTFGGQSKNGVTIRLDGDSGDDLELIVQDDLTVLDHFHILAQGHVVTD